MLDAVPYHDRGREPIAALLSWGATPIASMNSVYLVDELRRNGAHYILKVKFFT